MVGSKSNVYSLLIGLSFILAFVGITVYFFFEEAEREESLPTLHSVEKRSFTLMVSERGVINPARIVPITSQISSNQAKIVWLVKEGTQVRKGILVARFDTKPFMDQLDKVEQDLVDAQATFMATQKALSIQMEEEEGKIEAAARKLEIAKAEAADILQGSGPLERKVIKQRLQQKERSIAFAKLELKDLETILEKGYISARERDKAKDDILTVQEELDVIREELKNFDSYIWPQMQSKASLLVSGAESDLQRTKRTAELVIQNHKSEVEKTRRLVQTKSEMVRKAQRDVINCDVYAPASGILLYSDRPRDNGRRKFQIGDSVWVGQAFLQIPDTSELVADINVREVDVARIDRTMNTILEVDAFPNRKFSGEVESIATLALEENQLSGVRKYPTRIRLLGETGKIHVGMSVTAHIVYKNVNNVLAVPLSAIKYKKGKTSVQVLNDGISVEYPITIGSKGSLWVEVLNGLSLGDTVLLPSR